MAEYSRSGWLEPRSGAARSVGPILMFVALNGLLQPRFVVPGLGAAGRPAALFALGLFVWWCFGRLLPAERRPPGGFIQWWCFAYLVTFLLAVVAGIDRGLPGIEQRSMDRAFLITLAMGGVILVAQDVVVTMRDVDRVVSWVVALGAVSAFIAVLQFAAGVDLSRFMRLPGLILNADQAEIATRGHAEYRRVRGTALHPIEYGVHLAMVLPLAIYLATYSTTRRRVWWCAVLLLLAGIPLSISRSGVLALAVAMLVFAIGLTWRQRANLFTIAIASGLAFMVVTPGLLGTIRSMFVNASSDDSIAGRTGDYSVVAEFVSERPWFGRGPGTYIPSQYRVLDNQYLASLLETGWPGLFTLTMVLLAALFGAARIIRTSTSERERAIGYALCASIAVAPVTFATFDGLGFPILSGTLIVLIGCVAGLNRGVERSSESMSQAPERFVSAGVR